MPKSKEMMIRDILDWPISSDAKLAFIGQVIGAKAAPTVGAKGPAAKTTAKKQRAVRKPAQTGFTNKARLWSELKRLSPEEAVSLSYTQLTTEKLKAMLNDVKKR